MAEEVTKMEYDLRSYVKGKTIINHSIRLQLKLTLEEYVLLDFIYTWNQNEKAPATFRNFYTHTGIIQADVKHFLGRMKEKGLIIWDAKNKRVEAYSEWVNAFSSDGLLDILWKIHAKGSKASARERLPKVLKKISFEELKQKYQAYIDSCAGREYQFIKGLDVFLNPKKEHWNDPIAAPSTQKQKIVSRFKQ